MARKRDPRLDRFGVTGFNRPKRTPNHPSKTHVVVAKDGDKIRTIRFGDKKANLSRKTPKTAGKAQPDGTGRMKSRGDVFKSKKNTDGASNKLTATYWQGRTKW